MKALLDVRNLSVRFSVRRNIWDSLWGRGLRYVDAVINASFTIEAGKTYGIVGESGSGKTTLARAITGLHHGHAGEIWFAGQNLCGLNERQMRPIRREIVMIFQDAVGSLSPRVTVEKLITEPFLIHRSSVKMSRHERRAEANRLLAMVGLPLDIGQRYPYQLSGGQARRVGLARALALSPKLLIADEPTAGLDVSVQGEMLNLLRQLQDDFGLAILIITHNLNIVRHITDNVGIMYLGRFIERGVTDTVFSLPQHPYTKALLLANPKPDPDAEHFRMALKGEPPSLYQRPSGCEFHPRCPFAHAHCQKIIPNWQKINDQHGHRCHTPRLWVADQ